MLVGELDGEPVADAYLIGKGIAQNGYAGAGLYVLPRARRRGVGRAIADVLAEATAAYGLPGLSDSVHALDEESLAAAGRLGYEVVGHRRESVLNLDTLDEAAATSSVTREPSRPGSPCRSSAARRRRRGSLASWRLTTSRSRPGRDAPGTLEGSDEQMPYSAFRGFLPEPSYVLMAWRDGRPVGVIGRDGPGRGDEALNTFFTGVRREVRQRGAGPRRPRSKAQHALTMRALGDHRIFTQNMDQNAPILAANDRLGFTVMPGYYAVGRAVEQSGGG